MNMISALSKFNMLRAIVIGDIMLDRFVYGDVGRLNPESPAPLMSLRDTKAMLGGAGNVVRNITGLGAMANIFTVVGDDQIGNEVKTLLGKDPRCVANVTTEKGRPTTLKMRYVAEGQQLLRVDSETKRAISDQTSRRLFTVLTGEFSNHDVLIISDYQKGVLSKDMMRLIINMARTANIPVIVDPKPRHPSEYHGATVITPNLNEFKKIALIGGCPITDIDTDDDIMRAATWLSKTYDIAYVLVTRSEDGMTLASSTNYAAHIPATAHEVIDVSGAGDTVVATLSLALAAGMDIDDAARMANIAAGIVVERSGTSAISQLDMQPANIANRRVGGLHKIVTLEHASDIARNWRREGKMIGFTNGCFDLFHGGHINIIGNSKARCDRLVVAINSNNSVKQLKGKARPIQDQHERAMILAGREEVDLVIIYDELTPLKAISAIKPDRLFKGSDHHADTVVGASIVREHGGEVVILPRTETTSTTQLIERAQAAFKPELIICNNTGATQ